MGLNITVRSSAISDRGDNLCVFLFISCISEPILKRSFALNGKNLLPKGANSYLLRVNPFSEGRPTFSYKVASPECAPIPFEECGIDSMLFNYI